MWNCPLSAYIPQIFLLFKVISALCMSTCAWIIIVSLDYELASVTKKDFPCREHWRGTQQRPLPVGSAQEGVARFAGKACASPVCKCRTGRIVINNYSTKATPQEAKAYGLFSVSSWTLDVGCFLCCWWKRQFIQPLWEAVREYLQWLNWLMHALWPSDRTLRYTMPQQKCSPKDTY